MCWNVTSKEADVPSNMHSFSCLSIYNNLFKNVIYSFNDKVEFSAAITQSSVPHEVISQFLIVINVKNIFAAFFVEK